MAQASIREERCTRILALSGCVCVCVRRAGFPIRAAAEFCLLEGMDPPLVGMVRSSSGVSLGSPGGSRDWRSSVD
eukprot:13522546-Alexandrium_andersonii.AAC.1